MTNLIAGIDVSKHNLNVHVNGQDLEFGHTRESLRSLAKHLAREGVERVVREATGRMHRTVARLGELDASHGRLSSGRVTPDLFTDGVGHPGRPARPVSAAMSSLSLGITRG